MKRFIISTNNIKNVRVWIWTIYLIIDWSIFNFESHYDNVAIVYSIMLKIEVKHNKANLFYVKLKNRIQQGHNCDIRTPC